MILVNILAREVRRQRSDRHAVPGDDSVKFGRRHFRLRGADGVEVLGLGCGGRRGGDGDDNDIHLGVLGQAERLVGMDRTSTVSGVNLDGHWCILARGRAGATHTPVFEHAAKSGKNGRGASGEAR